MSPTARCTPVAPCASSPRLSGTFYASAFRILLVPPSKTPETRYGLPLARRAHRYQSPAGLVLTALVYIVYQVALSYEECVTRSAPSPSPRTTLTPSLSRGPTTQPLHRRDLRKARRGAQEQGRQRRAVGQLERGPVARGGQGALSAFLIECWTKRLKGLRQPEYGCAALACATSMFRIYRGDGQGKRETFPSFNLVLLFCRSRARPHAI